ncbi:hypothetical protein HAX54_031394, partial [Datura stramonium]|nr:hypothetical protein [Datura stramonium]
IGELLVAGDRCSGGITIGSAVVVSDHCSGGYTPSFPKHKLPRAGSNFTHSSLILLLK